MKNQKEYSEEEKKKWYHKIDKRHRPKKAPISQGKKWHLPSVTAITVHILPCFVLIVFRINVRSVAVQDG